MTLDDTEANMKEGDRVVGNACDYYHGRAGVVVAAIDYMVKVFFDIQKPHLNDDFNEMDMAFWYWQSELKKERSEHTTDER